MVFLLKFYNYEDTLSYLEKKNSSLQILFCNKHENMCFNSKEDNPMITKVQLKNALKKIVTELLV